MDPIPYNLTEADIVAGNDLWRRQQIKPWALVVAAAFVGLVIFCVLQALELPATALNILLMAAAGLVAMSATLLFGKWNSRRIALRYFRQSPASHRDIALAWTDTHLSLTQPDAYQNRPWSDARGWAENDEVIAMFAAGPIFTPLPKRILTPALQDDIRACLECAKVPKRPLFPI